MVEFTPTTTRIMQVVASHGAPAYPAENEVIRQFTYVLLSKLRQQGIAPVEDDTPATVETIPLTYVSYRAFLALKENLAGYSALEVSSLEKTVTSIFAVLAKADVSFYALPNFSAPVAPPEA